MSGLYQAFRTNGAPTFYESNKTPVQGDIVEGGLIFCLVILAASFYVVLLGNRGKDILFAFIRVTVSLYIGGVILVSNFAYEWEGNTIYNTTTKYKAGDGHDIHADIGLHMGLRGINITLKGVPENQLNETINYNEHVSWEWRQGRLGFGVFAGRFNREYRALQIRGAPFPILWIAEYFTFDGEGARWGRHYRQAGWYAHIVLWLAFPLWVLTNVLFFVLLRYGAYFLCLTGASMVTSCIIWTTIRNPIPLVIPFTDIHVIRPVLGSSFYICIITGVIAIVLGIIIAILDLRFPGPIATFFNVDVLQDSEAILVEDDTPAKPEDQKDDEDGEDEVAARGKNGASNGAADRPESVGDDEIYEMPTVHRRGERGLTQRFQKNRRNKSRRPAPPPVPEDSDGEDYVNEDVVRQAARGGPRGHVNPAHVQIEMQKR